MEKASSLSRPAAADDTSAIILLSGEDKVAVKENHFEDPIPEAPPSGAIRAEINFRGVIVLAPMVRITTLPLRLLALAQGADLVWTEEMVAKKVAPCKRIENPRLGTVEFYDQSSPWTRVWQTCRKETSRVVFQIGT